MENWALFLIVMAGLWNFVILVVAIAGFVENHNHSRTWDMTPDCLLPYRLHNGSAMNWFGSWLCSILLLALMPAAYILQVFWWLCHIGRK